MPVAVKQNSSETFSVRLAKNKEGDNGRWLLERKLLVGTQGGGHRASFICFGVVGGEFHSADGNAVRVLEVDFDDPRSPKVSFHLIDSNEGVEQTV